MSLLCNLDSNMTAEIGRGEVRYGPLSVETESDYVTCTENGRCQWPSGPSLINRPKHILSTHITRCIS